MPDIRDWKRSLITLNDEPFFDLVSTYLGKVQTPFHKPSIINALERFLLKPETQERIFLLMNEDENTAVGFIQRAGGADLDSLYAYFKEEYSSLRFSSLVDNLTERLIIYRDEENRYQINPVLAEGLVRDATPDAVERIPSSGDEWEIWLSEDLFIAFLALAKELTSFCKQNGELKKATLAALKERLPEGATEEAALLLLESALALGTLRDDGGELSLNEEALRSVFKLPHHQRTKVLAAGVAAIAWNEYPRELAYQAGRFIVGSLAANLKPGFGYRRETLLLHLSEAPGAGELEISPHRLDRAFELLERADFIRNEEGFFRFSLQEPVEGEPSRPMILQPTFEILLSPDASPAAKVFTALHCRLLRYDRVAKYELEHDLFLHPLRQRGIPVNLLEELETACGGSVPQNIAVTLQGWLEESRQIEIATGTVVKVSPEMVPVIDEHFSALLLETLAPGIYFVRPEKVSAFLTRWRSLGYADPGEVRNLLSVEQRTPTYDYVPSLVLPEIPLVQSAENTSPSIGPHETAWEEADRKSEEIHRELRSRLEEQELTPEQRRELNAKIEKKLFLFPDQVEPSACRVGRIEARGIDFHAKLRVVEDVLNNRDDLLEIDSPEADDGNALVHPLSLNKEPGNPTLVALVLPEEKERSFRIRLASRIRKRKRSLFY